MTLIVSRYHPSKSVCREHAFERSHRLVGQSRDCGVARMDGRAWDPQFEPNLGLRPRWVLSRIRKTQAERQRRTVSLRQGRRAQPTKDAQAVLDSAQLREIDQVDHDRHVPHESTARLVEIDIDTRVRAGMLEVEEEVRAPRRLSVPPTLELMAGGLLQTGQLPPGCLDPLLHGLDERPEREYRLCWKIRHDRLTAFPMAR